MLKAHVTIASLTEDSWLDTHVNIMDTFLSDSQRLLVAYMDPINGLVLDFAIPCNPVHEMSYFIKKDSDSSEEITCENFLKLVQYGTVAGGQIESLLRVMSGVYAPMFFENTSWPDSIKNDFFAQLHKFLASLTDTRWKMVGKTVLYMPNEGPAMNSETAAKNKDLVQRLESENSVQILDMAEI